MSGSARFPGLLSLIAAALLAATSGPAWAADADAAQDNTRGVHIIDAPDPPEAASPPSLPAVRLPPAAAPAAAPAPVPAPTAAVPSRPTPSAPAAYKPTPTASAPPKPGAYDLMSVQPRPVDLGATPAGAPQRPLDTPAARRQATLGAIPIDAKIANTAELSLELLPGLDIAAGAKVSFRVTTKKNGYLILVDVDANGKLTQIYPVASTLLGNRPARPNGNYITAGKPVQIPRSGDEYAGIEYVATPPFGTAMIVAILSDRPVQILDLPDVPEALTGQAEALAFLTRIARELRIPQGDGGQMQEARFSFDAKFYAIR